MIYTVTVNPAIDYIMHVSDVKEGGTNRSEWEEYHLGGKGINVSRVLKELGMESVILGFIGGFTGQALEEGLRVLGLKTDFVKLSKGITRINVKVKSSEETEINGQGHPISDEEMELLLEKLDKLTSYDMLVISGNLPKSMKEETYFDILERVSCKGVKIIMDATGPCLKKALKFRPFLVKPNLQELIETVGETDTLDEGAQRLKEFGARNVLISKGRDGASLYTEDGRVFECGIVDGNVCSTVGAGDSMVAGFIAGYAKTADFEYALKLGSAAGCATAYTSGLADREQIEECFEKLENKKES